MLCIFNVYKLSHIPCHTGTVVPLLKDTLVKGHLSNKDRVIVSKYYKCL